MNDALQWMILIGIAVFVVAAFYVQTRSRKQQIREYLLSKGARDIAITWIWVSHERDSGTYDVAYTDHLGNRRQTRCKIRDDGWYWKEPPEV